MEEQKKSNDIEEAASALIANAENENTADQPEITPKESKATEENDNRIFKKYRIKDIVFLAIITPLSRLAHWLRARSCPCL